LFLRATNWSANSCTSAAVNGLPPGWTLVTVFVNGIPSPSSILSLRDTTPPVLTLLGDNPLIHEAGTPFTDPGATATDLCAGDLTASIVTNITVNPNVLGTYTNSFTVADGSGNTAQTNRTVLVIAQPVFAGYSVPAPGQFGLRGTGTAGLTYTLQTSTNLVDWTDHTSVVAGPAGLIECLETMDPGAPACFYRLRWP